MRDRVPIFSGSLIFVMLFMYPVWHGIAAKSSSQEPVLQMPSNQKTCVASREYMRSSHMQLLLSWRDNAVRQQKRDYINQTGANYKVNLTNTCLQQCHGSRKDFCDRCHNYVALSTPYCWDCHQDASTKEAATTANAGPEKLP